MPLLQVSGHSDDIVCLDGAKDEELYTDNQGKVELLIGQSEATQGQDAHGLRVTMTYGVEMAVWSATISQIDEDTKCPWSVSLTFQGYSPTVTIDCGEDTPVFVRKHGSWVNIENLRNGDD